MPKLQKVSGDIAIRSLEKIGFKKVRQRGSHFILKKQTPEGETGLFHYIRSWLWELCEAF
jgi:predicted RNA binding protein YcfA (HicA-like mRNA interferase family)